MGIRSFVMMAGIFIFILSAMMFKSHDVRPAVAFVGIESTVRANDYLPTDHSSEAMHDLATALEGDDKLSNVQFKIKLPQPDQQAGQFTVGDLSKVTVDLVGPTAKSLQIQVDPAQSSLNVATVNGEEVVYGQLTGTITYKNGSKAEMTTGVLAITKRHLGHFAVAISAHGNVPPLTLAFGNLDPTQELQQLVLPR